MSQISVGIVNYSCGNSFSLRAVLIKLNFKVIISDEISQLNDCDLIILPGVGAFPNAVNDLKRKGLFNFLIEHAYKDKPLIGICLGMQLLSDVSSEFGHTQGLKIIPGKVTQLGKNSWHIGWNKINNEKKDKLFQNYEDCFFFFNHSYIFDTPEKYKICKTSYKIKFPSVVRNKKTIGFQFHPEKSQAPGESILKKTIINLIQ